MSAGPPTETGSIEIPKPRFQSRPYRATPAKMRKPLPRHIVKQILDASNARPRARHPLLLEMQARARAKLEAGKAKKATTDKDG